MTKADHIFNITDYETNSPSFSDLKLPPEIATQIKSELIKCQRMAEYVDAEDLSKMLCVCIEQLNSY